MLAVKREAGRRNFGGSRRNTSREQKASGGMSSVPGGLEIVTSFSSPLWNSSPTLHLYRLPPVPHPRSPAPVSPLHPVPLTLPSSSLQQLPPQASGAIADSDFEHFERSYCFSHEVPFSPVEEKCVHRHPRGNSE